MKKVYLLCVLLLLGTILHAVQPMEMEKSNLKIYFTEFGYPLVPRASQVKIQSPVLNDGVEASIWYRALSPYLLPQKYFEIGASATVNVIEKEKSSLCIGMGTAYSQNDGTYSIPLILPIEYRYMPWQCMRFTLSMHTMVYREGFLSECMVETAIYPLSTRCFIDIGGTVTIAFSWTDQIMEYSYGMLFGVGYQL